MHSVKRILDMSTTNLIELVVIIAVIIVAIRFFKSRG